MQSTLVAKGCEKSNESKPKGDNYESESTTFPSRGKHDGSRGPASWGQRTAGIWSEQATAWLWHWACGSKASASGSALQSHKRHVEREAEYKIQFFPRRCEAGLVHAHRRQCPESSNRQGASDKWQGVFFACVPRTEEPAVAPGDVYYPAKQIGIVPAAACPGYLKRCVWAALRGSDQSALSVKSKESCPKLASVRPSGVRVVCGVNGGPSAMIHRARLLLAIPSGGYSRFHPI